MKKARKDGRLAEALLDRRTKLKRCVLVLLLIPFLAHMPPTLSHTTFFPHALTDRIGQSSLHNPFHSRRALYSRSDWSAATDSVDHCHVSARTRALTSQGFHSLVMSILFSIQLTYSPPFDAIDGQPSIQAIDN